MLAAALGGRNDAPLRILCLGAHSDDIEIGCGGTVLRLLAERPGSSVDWIVFSATSVREEEARASAAEFLAQAGRASIVVKTFRESYFPALWAEIKDAFEELRSVEPDVVLTHRRRDEHQDHRVLGELTWNTFRRQLILEYEIPKYEGDLDPPNFFVPLLVRWPNARWTCSSATLRRRSHAPGSAPRPSRACLPFEASSAVRPRGGPKAFMHAKS